jgi:general secretion pathway protein H
MKNSLLIGNRQSAITNGFTLIEIMLVVVIIGIAVGVAVPMFSGTSGTARMRDAVRSTVRISRYARCMAIINQTDCTLTFATNRITLTDLDGKNLADRRMADQVKMTYFENLAGDVEKKQVLFYSSGMNDGFELTLEDDEGRRHEVTCNPITGNVEVEGE